MSTGTVMTVEAFKAALPSSKIDISEEVIADINNIISNSDVAVEFRENLISYTSVMATGRVRIKDYISAVKFVTYKMLGDGNTVAFSKTFPDRYMDMLSKGMVAREISSRAAMYNKTKLLTKIYEQTLVPVHILNADIYQQAINTQASLMLNANSEKVRSDAANSLLTHLKAPETKKIELDIGLKQDQSIDDLRKTTLELVAQQKKMIISGAFNSEDIAHSKLCIEGESEVVQD